MEVSNLEGNTILSGDINSLRIYRNVVEEYDKVKEACNQAAMDEKNWSGSSLLIRRT